MKKLSPISASIKSIFFSTMVKKLKDIMIITLNGAEKKTNETMLK